MLQEILPKMEQEKLLLVVAGVIACALTAFVIWGPSNIKPKRRKGDVGGLVNFGHSCFLNTLLQAFGSCPYFLHWLSRNEQQDGIIATLRLAIQVINGEHRHVHDDPYSPLGLFRWIKARYRISSGEQDAHELFVFVIAAMEEEAARLKTSCSLADALCLSSNSEPALGRQLNGDFRLRATHSDTLIGRSRRVLRPTTSMSAAENATPFQGMLTSGLQCITCNHKNVVQCSKLDCLSLALPAANAEHRVTLARLLEQFVAVETVSVRCNGCKLECPARKTLNFAKLPGCLCIHIVRTTWTSSGQPLKRTDHVDFPAELAMDAYTYAQREGETRKHLYDLRAVVVHRGDLNQGHFLTYRKVKDKWYVTSDSDVSETTWWRVQQASAYMLFYDKRLQSVPSS